MDAEEKNYEHSELLNEIEHLREEINALRAKNHELHADFHGNAAHTHISDRVLIDSDAIANIQLQLNTVLSTIAGANMDVFTMTDAQRSRLLGAGVRRYGFIEKTDEVSGENTQFFPGFLTHKQLNEANLQIGTLRNLITTAQQILRIITDHYLLTSDEAFRMSRLYYISVRDAARNGIPGAHPVFNILRELFRRSGIKTDKTPTIPEVERDVHALLHGHKDGRIVIEHEHPHKVGGKHVVVDETPLTTNR